MARLSDELLANFHPNLVRPLIQYHKELSQIDCDFLIFMARKALRLNDLLAFMGGRKPRSFCYSDHILDQDLSRLKGKRVVLADDTVILGTTLGRTVDALRKADISVASVHAFAIDKDNWCRDLVPSLNYHVTLTAQEMLNFCASEVAALNAAAIPYLSDLPFSKVFKLSFDQIERLDRLRYWRPYNVTDISQDSRSVVYLTFLPTEDQLNRISRLLPSDLFDLLDLVKIRLFARSTSRTYWARIVPIVTLRPIKLDILNNLFDELCSAVLGRQTDLLQLSNQCLKSPRARLRFCQYVLSVEIGRIFVDELSALRPAFHNQPFDLEEGMRHYGRWMRKVLLTVHSNPLRFSEGDQQRAPIRLAEADVPKDVQESTQKRMNALFPRGNRRYPLPELYVCLSKAFIDLYHQRELPARKEVQRLGVSALSATPDQAPNLDRLSFGYDWRTLAESLIPDKTIRHIRVNYLSLLLDSLIDLGVAVPIVCERQGVLFRAYRHGEDVLLIEQNMALSYQVISGFLSGANRTHLPSIVLEKLLVTLFKGLAAQSLVQITHDAGPGFRRLRVGYYLHGAVMFMPEAETVIADSVQSWLSRRLEADGTIVKREQKGKMVWQLGAQPQTSYDTPELPKRAEHIGRLIGRLYAARHTDGTILLTQDDLVALTTCTSSRDVAAALAAELQLLVSWGTYELRSAIRRAGPDLAAELPNLVATITESRGLIALESAIKKLDFYRSARAKLAVERCAKHLEQTDKILADVWEGWWEPLVTSTQTDTAGARKFDECIKIQASAVQTFSYAISGLSRVLLVADSNHLITSGDRSRLQTASDLPDRLLALTNYETERQNKFRKLNFDKPVDAKQFEFTRISRISQWLASQLRGIEQMNKSTLQQIISHGQIEKMVHFEYVIWYDIIDSTGAKCGKKGAALKARHDQIRKLKSDLNAAFHELRIRSQKKKAFVQFRSQQHENKNDENYAFVAGEHRWEWIRQIIKILLEATKLEQSAVRIILVPGNFSGTAVGAPERPMAQEPYAPGFWEHFKSLQTQIRAVENSLPCNPRGKLSTQSLLWLWDRGFASHLDPSGKQYVWSHPEEYRFDSVFGDDLIDVRLWGGSISLAKTDSDLLSVSLR